MAGPDDYYKYNDDDLANLRAHLEGDRGGPAVLPKDQDGNVIDPNNPRPGALPTSAIRLYDDRTDQPKRSLKEMAAYGLIPLVAGLAGGLMNGQQGAYAGASSGLNALKEKVDNEDNNYEKVRDTKEINRSHIITAKLIKDIGNGKDGAGGSGSINKNRFSVREGINAQTGEPMFLKWDRQDGKLEFVSPDGKTVPYTSEIYKRWRPTGDGSAASATGDIPSPAPQGAQGGPAAALAGAADDEGTFNYNGQKPTKPAQGQATRLPKTTGAPAPAAPVKPAPPMEEPDITEGAVVPKGVTKDQATAAADNELSGILAQKDAEIEEARKDTDTNLRPGENIADAERRAAAAIRAMADARQAKDKARDLNVKFKLDLSRDNTKNNFDKELAKIKSDLDTTRGKILNRDKGDVQKDVNSSRAEDQKGVNSAKGSIPKDTSYEARVGALKGSDRQHYDQAVMGLRAADDMGAALGSGSNTFSLFGDNPFTIALRNWNEAIGRLQSGGAINKDEESRFRKMAPGPTDNAATQRQKLNEMKGEMSARINTFGIDPKEALTRRRAIDAAASSGGTDRGIEAMKEVVKKSTNGVWMVSPDGKERMLVRPDQVQKYKDMKATVEGAE